MAKKKKHQALSPRPSAKRVLRRRPKSSKRVDLVPPNPVMAEQSPPPVPRPHPPMPDTSSFDTAAVQAIDAWKARLRVPVLLTGGAVEPLPVPIDSVPRLKPQPDLSASGGPQLDTVAPIPDLEGFTDEEAIEIIKEWFLSNFEDPAQGTPRNDGEFLYVWGGPCSV
jgi:hypothetical protein